MIEVLAAASIGGFARLLTSVRSNWIGCSQVSSGPRVYFANHASHGDFVLIWTVLTPVLKRRVRPVAGGDYWTRGPIRKWVADKVFRAIIIDRTKIDRSHSPLPAMAVAIDQGASLIVFPEGTRNTTDALLLPFKCGLYHLAKMRPSIEFMPVWIANLNRVLPKGEWLPVPMLCRVTFGRPIKIAEGESKAAFLKRAHVCLADLAGPKRGDLQ